MADAKSASDQMQSRQPPSRFGKQRGGVLSRFWGWQRSAFPQEALCQLRALIESYKRIRANQSPAPAPRVGSDGEIEILSRRLDETPNDVCWADVAQAQLILVELYDDTAVRSGLLSWRRRLREVMGESRYALYQATAMDPDAKDANPTLLRADLNECIRAVYYFYGVYGLGARSRSAVTKETFIVAVLVLVAMAAIGSSPLAEALRPWLSYVLLASAAAVLGSLVSVQQRLQDPKIDVDPIFRYIQLKADRFSVAFVSPIFGAIFGVVAYGLLASGLITGGAIIPRFGPGSVPADTSATWLTLIYAFLAGFSERFVPDALNRLAARALPFVGGTAPIVSPVTLAAPSAGGKSAQLGSTPEVTGKPDSGAGSSSGQGP